MNQELKAGALVAFGGFAQAIVYGMLAFAPLGAVGLQYGVYAGLASAVLGAATGAALGKAPAQFGGPRSSTALIIAGSLIGFSQFTQDPALLCALVGLEVVLAGVFVAIAQRQGLGTLMQFLPAPVLIGMNTTLGLFSAIKLLPAMLGFAVYSTLFQALGSPLSASWLALVVSAFTIAVLLWFRIARPNPLGLVYGLAAGFVVHGALTALFDDHAFATHLSRVVGVAPAHPLAHVSEARALVQGLYSLLLGQPQLLLQVLVAAFVTALLIVLESMQALLMVDQTLNHRHNTRQELNALAVANLLCGLALALPSSNYASRSNAGLGMGSKNRRSEGWFVLVLSLMLILLWPLIAQLPMHILATAVAISSLFLIQGRTARLLLSFIKPAQRRAMGTQDRFTAWVVIGMLSITAFSNLLVGTLAGVLFVAIYFMRQQSSGGLDAIEKAPAARSKTLRPRPDRQKLNAAFEHSYWLHFDGNLFFGNAPSIAIRLEDELADAKALILDFSQVRYMDDTACQALEKVLANRLKPLRPRTVAVLAHTQPDLAGLHMLEKALVNLGITVARHIDDAFFALENTLLGKPGATPDVLPALEHHARDVACARQQLQLGQLCEQMNDAQSNAFAKHWCWRDVPQGSTLFREGDPADGLYLLTSGQLSAWRQTGKISERLMRFCPGSMVGEMAVIDGKWRSATVMADTNCTLLHLAQQEWSALDHELAQQLVLNLARELALRIRLANHNLDLHARR